MRVRPRRSDRSTRRTVALLFALTALITGLITARLPAAIGSSVSAAGPTTSRFAPLDLQVRVLDTRQAASPIQRLAAGGALSIDPVTADVATSAGVEKSDIVAVVANVTLDSADGWGFATVYPEGEGQPDSSSINTDTPGQTVANMVTARLGAGGQITISSSIGTDVIVDVQGVYVRASACSRK